VYRLEGGEGGAGGAAPAPRPAPAAPATKLERRLAGIRRLAGADGSGGPVDTPSTLTLRQAPFTKSADGAFASTVWDSSIVVSKMLERHPSLVRGRRCLDLSAGVGLVAAVMARVGAAHVAATDLGPNLGLLRENLSGANVAGAEGRVAVAEHRWGEGVDELVAELGGRPSVLVGCDLMYIDDPATVRALVATVRRLPDWDRAGACVLFAHGRNNRAEPMFVAECGRQGLACEEVPDSELHPGFVAEDVAVLRVARSG